MIYLDYAANTPVDPKVLKAYNDATMTYIANPNSSHSLGKIAKLKIDEASESIGKYFNTCKENIIYTSGSSESNNLVIKGICERNKDKGNHIIISAIEHSSVVAPVNYLVSNGFDVSIIPLDSDGKVNLKQLKKTINSKTILVSICAVDSELGTVQPIDEIAAIVKKHKKCVFHTDATQAIGKTEINYDNVDFVTFAPHKFFGLNGMGVLVNRNAIKITPLIHGGKSTTIYRSGTPVIANAISTEVAFKLATKKFKKRYNQVKKLNTMLRKAFSKLNYVHINSPENAIPNTLNISLINKDTKDIVKKLNQKEIYVSTTTACSLDNSPSKSVFAITGDEELAKNTIRISISHLTTTEEIKDFLKVFKKITR